MDNPGMALMEARDRIYEYDDAKEEKEHQAALQASLKRWEMIEGCFNKVPKKFWPICQFKVPKGITTEAGEETCQGLMLCPSDANYEPNGNHETDDEILLSRTDSIKCSIMEAGCSNSELVLRSAHKDIEKLAATAAQACDGFSQGFAQLMSISKLYLFL